MMALNLCAKYAKRTLETERSTVAIAIDASRSSITTAMAQQLHRRGELQTFHRTSDCEPYARTFLL
jgi:hypothetical protein